MSKTLAIAALAAFIALPAATTAASASTWEFLGVRQISTIVDHDKIHVGLAEGPFKQIRFKVRGNNLWVYDVDVNYRNGGHQDVNTRFFIPQGGQSRTIGLNGNYRIIKNVQFTYGKLPNGNGKAFVELWGKR